MTQIVAPMARAWSTWALPSVSSEECGALRSGEALKGRPFRSGRHRIRLDSSGQRAAPVFLSLADVAATPRLAPAG